MTAEATPPPPPPVADKSQKPRIAIGMGILVAVVAAYVLSLLGVHLLQKSEGPLPPLDLSTAGPEDTIVQVRLEDLKPVTNRVTVNVLVYPGESLSDKRFDVLTTDIAVRLYPPTTWEICNTRKGKPQRKSTLRSRRTAIPVTGRSIRTKPRNSRPMYSSDLAITAKGYLLVSK